MNKPRENKNSFFVIFYVSVDYFDNIQCVIMSILDY